MHQMTKPLADRMEALAVQTIQQIQHQAAQLGVPDCAIRRSAALAVKRMYTAWLEMYVDQPCPAHDTPSGDGPCPPPATHEEMD